MIGVMSGDELVAEGEPATLKGRAEGGERSLEEVFLEVTSDREADGRLENGPAAPGRG